MEGSIGFLILIIIVSSLYIYNDYMKNVDTIKSEDKRKNIMFMIKPALVGLAASILLVLILQTIFLNTYTTTSIVISTIICGCTGWIVQTLKEMKN